MKIPRLVLAGATSGVGKTSITCGIIYGLKKRGYSVQSFKVGPDYIDPSYLSSISETDSRNLDPWLMGKSSLIQSFVTNSKSDISIIEGVMGYYDGFSGTSNFSSTHHVANILKSPVVLVLDASKTARSIAATALGFKKFHRNSCIVGLILNKIGSKKHEILCRQALESVKIPILGIIPKNNSFSLDSRHLGLIPTKEQKSQKTKIKKISKEISDYLDFEYLIKICNNVKSLNQPTIKLRKKIKTKIAIALDNSFNFYYQDNIDALKREGAEITFFSPIHDPKIPQCNGLYIGGGFPEILGKELAKNQNMKKTIKKLSENDIPIYAECGGLMYLSKSISFGNQKFKMAGIFDAETKMTKKMKLNYTQGKISKPCIISKKSTNLRGHEFHYSELVSVSKDSKFAYELSIGDGIKKQKDGLLQNNTLASYGHLYFDSSNYAANFVQNCIKSSRQ